MEEIMPTKVYVRLAPDGCVLSVDSSIFLTNTTGWTQISEGFGDRYSHAQGNYFSKGIITEDGLYRYRLLDGKTIEKTEDELREEAKSISPQPEPEIKLLKAQVKALSDYQDFIEECLVEMAGLIYAG